MKAEFLSLIRSPSRQTYLAARTVLLRSNHFDPFSEELNEIVAAIEEKKWDDAASLITDAGPNLLLSPCAHLLMAKVCENRGEEERWEFETVTARAICDGILSTGDGSQDAPYLITRTTDEHDILGYLQKTFESQSLVHQNGKSYDKVCCAGGDELWFDITDLYAIMMRRT
ncbi:hypothetical protein [Roseiconus lacunae]|uniref:hypothetical protein n=1 Tax=Roseiconus lacunae TaxID=2605694 RepID=UPI0011F22338|nr:hypothetical protein [Roseiconus lacunae]